jgi:hypothetical protein
MCVKMTEANLRIKEIGTPRMESVHSCKRRESTAKLPSGHISVTLKTQQRCSERLYREQRPAHTARRTRTTPGLSTAALTKETMK